MSRKPRGGPRKRVRRGEPAVEYTQRAGPGLPEEFRRRRRRRRGLAMVSVCRIPAVRLALPVLARNCRCPAL